MRTRDREDAQLACISCYEPSERRVAGRVLLTSVGHDEGGSVGGIEACDCALAERVERSVECHAYSLLHLSRVAWRKEIHAERSDDGHDRGGHQSPQPPSEKRAPGWIFGGHCTRNYARALHAQTM